MRALYALAPLLCACTLIESKDGLAGPPLAAEDAGGDAIADGAAPRDAASDAPAAEGGAPDVLFAGLDAPVGLAVDATSLYWAGGTTAHGLFRAAKTGAGAPVHVDEPAEPIGAPFDVAVDATTLYWSDRATGQVLRKPLAGGAQSHCFDGATSAAYLTLDADALYVTDFRDPTVSGSVVRGTCAASSGTVIFTAARTTGIAVAAKTLYFGRATPDAIDVGPSSGSTPNTRFSGAGGAVSGVATDGTTLYWIEDAKRVLRMRIDTRAPETLYTADAAFGDGDVAVDDAFVYWSESAAGKIRRMKK